jgi:osmoprotectant transport system ATP-binding protein
VAGGSLYVPERAADSSPAGSMRNALDAALSSPAEVGVAVDGDGAVLGGVRAADVLDALAKARSERDGGRFSEQVAGQVADRDEAG